MRLVLAFIVIALFFAIIAVNGSNETPKVVVASDILAKIKVGDPVEYDHVIIKGDLDLSQLELPNKYFALNSSEIGLGFPRIMNIIDSGIRIRNSIVEDNINFSNAVFMDEVDFFNTSLKRYVLFKESHFDRDVNFGESRFEEGADFAGSHFNEHTDFSNSTFNGTADFSLSQFSGNSSRNLNILNKERLLEDALFLSSQYGKYAGFNEGFLESLDGSSNSLGATNFRGARFNEDTYFSVCEFDVDTDFSGAEFLGDANFRSSKFKNYIYFRSSQFNRTADFIQSQFSKYASFSSAIFERDVDFSLAQFKDNVYFRGSQFLRNTYFWGSKFNRDAFFEDANFKRDLDLRLAEYNKFYVRFSNINNLVYDDTVYQLLIENFKNLGFYVDANECYFASRKEQFLHEKFFDDPLRFILDFGAWVFYGYAKKPLYPLVWSFLFIATFGLFWIWVRLETTEWPTLTFSKNPSLWWYALTFSATVFLSGTRLFVDPPDVSTLKGRSQSLIRKAFTAERVLGAFFSILLFLAIGATVVR